MAEKYGEIPPRFTKQWWDYVWYYYKWHIIITVLAVIIAAVTIVQCATRTRYDMTVVYAGHKNYSETEINRIQEILSEYISDIDGNGEKNVMFMPLMFVDNAGSEEYDYAMQTKLDVSFTDDYTFIYLMDKQEAELYLHRENVDSTFVPVGDYISDVTLDWSDLLTADNDTAYGVNVSGNSLFTENDIYCDDLYAFVAVTSKTDEKNKLSQEEAFNIVKELTK